ncbi:MAG: tRNA (adenosine(37)-N6)-threonylcarbamoyltransferase complex dimerization subunit type 1 TsaB [bacterium]|nr:tRNA (adenosine(37)-N6)-threonylcarbamoyltransferase complex dimerization subunit type 1 TsaB [bacterium]
MEDQQELILGIEAAGSAVSVALAEAGRGLGVVWLDSGKPSGEILLQWIERLLVSCQRSREQLTGLALCLGPGSFTSMRISLATVQALGFALNLPIYTADRLRLTATAMVHQPEAVKVIQNAYKGELYQGVFDCRGNLPEPLEPLRLIRPEQFLAGLKPGQWVLGDGLKVLEGMDWKPEERGVLLEPAGMHRPDAMALIHLVRALGLRPAAGDIEPIYLRASEAEVAYVARFGNL